MFVRWGRFYGLDSRGVGGQILPLGTMRLSGFGGREIGGRWLQRCGDLCFLLVGCRVVARRIVLFTQILSLMFIRIHSFDSANFPQSGSFFGPCFGSGRSGADFFAFS